MEKINTRDISKELAMETLFEIEGSVAILTFNRPAARNALTWAMYDGLAAACEQVDANPNVRAFLLRGAGDRAFAAGTDIHQFDEFKDGEDGIRYEARIDAILNRLEQVKVPTIAEVRGVAAGGGCAIALCCDIRIGSTDASFGFPMARTLGNCLSAATCARMSASLPTAVLKDMIFTGRFMNAPEAQSLGLIARLASAEELQHEAMEYALAVSANAPLTIRASKEIFRRLQQSSTAKNVDDSDVIRLCYGSQDFREGRRAFLSKQPPHWQGM